MFPGLGLVHRAYGRHKGEGKKKAAAPFEMNNYCKKSLKFLWSEAKLVQSRPNR